MTQIQLTRDSDSIATLSLDEMEPISNLSFATLLQEHAQLIIARVQTRDKVQFRKKYHHYFYGPNLVKILFNVL